MSVLSALSKTNMLETAYSCDLYLFVCKRGHALGDARNFFVHFSSLPVNASLLVGVNKRQCTTCVVAVMMENIARVDKNDKMTWG